MDLIQNALETIRKLANARMENLDQRNDDWVVLTSLVDHDGSLNQSASDKIVMTVYNITRETVFSSYKTTMSAKPPSTAGDAFAVVSPPLYINVHLMFMANFTEAHYTDGLSALSRLISYFQQTPY